MPQLVNRLRREADSDQPSPGKRIWSQLDDSTKTTLEKLKPEKADDDERKPGEGRDIFRGSESAAWQVLKAPQSLPEAARVQAQVRLREFDEVQCGDKRFAASNSNALDAFEREDWSAFVDNGLVAKVRADDESYYRKPISAELLPCCSRL